MYTGTILRCHFAEPSFVFSDVIQKSPDGTEGDDDKVYFFFTEVSVEYEFVFKLMIPRVARVCKVSTPPQHTPVPSHSPGQIPISVITAVAFGWKPL